jgi:hypothetical protein
MGSELRDGQEQYKEAAKQHDNSTITVGRPGGSQGPPYFNTGAFFKDVLTPMVTSLVSGLNPAPREACRVATGHIREGG